MDKLIEALTLLRDSIDGVGRATDETADNPKWRYHRDTPHMKKMAGIYADWAAAVQVIIDNLPALSHAAGQDGEQCLDGLYHAVNRMMAVLGASGEICSRHATVNAVMDELSKIDGGQYREPGNPELDDADTLTAEGRREIEDALQERNRRNGEQCRAASGKPVAWIRPDGVTTSDAGLMRHWEAQWLQFDPLIRAISRGVPEGE